MPLSEILIVANSGRMLAQASQALGLSVVVIDCFGDLDTHGYAKACFLVESLSLVHLTPMLEQATRDYTITKVIYGSGFESYPESLEWLAQRFTLLGNSPAVFNRMLDKQAFFTCLDQLAIPYPAVSFQPPDALMGNWLTKPMQGQGGVGIKYYQPLTEPIAGHYWQRYQTGNPHSVLFLAVKGAVQVIGFNTQWCCELGQQAFVFEGIRTGSDLSQAQKALVIGWLQRLVMAFALQGLNSLDFICTDEGCYVMEINPRPSASMQLYSADWLGQFIQGCLGDMPLTTITTESVCRGYQVVFAVQPVLIPHGFAWPEWCVDRPKATTIIATTQPICSIIAHDPCWQQVMQLLQTRQQSLLYQLTNSI